MKGNYLASTLSRFKVYERYKHFTSVREIFYNQLNFKVSTRKYEHYKCKDTSYLYLKIFYTFLELLLQDMIDTNCSLRFPGRYSNMEIKIEEASPLVTLQYFRNRKDKFIGYDVYYYPKIIDKKTRRRYSWLISKHYSDQIEKNSHNRRCHKFVPI